MFHYTRLLRSLVKQLERSAISSALTDTCHRLVPLWRLNESRVSSSTIFSRKSNWPISKRLRVSSRIFSLAPCVHSRYFTIEYRDTTPLLAHKNISTYLQCSKVCGYRQKIVSADMQCCMQRSHSSWRTLLRIGDMSTTLLSGKGSTRISVAQYHSISTLRIHPVVDDK